MPQIWGPAPPPPGWPLPALVWAASIRPGIIFPSSYTYENLGTVKSKGLELGLDGRDPERSGPAFVNYSFQADPIPTFPGLTAAAGARGDQHPGEAPVQHRRDLHGAELASARWRSATPTEAFWQDVLDSRYHGYTQPVHLGEHDGRREVQAAATRRR